MCRSFRATSSRLARPSPSSGEFSLNHRQKVAFLIIPKYPILNCGKRKSELQFIWRRAGGVEPQSISQDNRGYKSARSTGSAPAAFRKIGNLLGQEYHKNVIRKW